MAQVWFVLLLDTGRWAWALVHPKGYESEELAMLGFLAVFVCVHKPFGPALILKSLFESHPQLGLAERYRHGLESTQRQLLDVSEIVLGLFLVDFFLELGELLSKAGHLAATREVKQTARLDDLNASRSISHGHLLILI